MIIISLNKIKKIVSFKLQVPLSNGCRLNLTIRKFFQNSIFFSQIWDGSVRSRAPG